MSVEHLRHQTHYKVIWLRNEQQIAIGADEGDEFSGLCTAFACWAKFVVSAMARWQSRKSCQRVAQLDSTCLRGGSS